MKIFGQVGAASVKISGASIFCRVVVGGTVGFVMLRLVSCRQYDSFYSNVQRSDVFIQRHENKYDFLWVFDNSHSMDDKRTYVKDHMQNFLMILNGRKAIDYQMAVITTDFFTDAGNLIKSPNGLEVVKSGSADPAGDFASIVNNVKDSVTSFWEQGLRSAEQAISNHGLRFMRNTVPLVVIVLSDENSYDCDEAKSSKGGVLGCFGGPPEKPETDRTLVFFPIERYTDYFRNIKKNAKTDISVFPIVGIEPSACINEAQGQGSIGRRYREVQQRLGFGVTGGICNDQLPKSYENIAQVVADRGVKFILSDPANDYGIRVTINEREVPYSETDGYVFSGQENAIIFTGKSIPKNGDLVEVTYSEKTT